VQTPAPAIAVEVVIISLATVLNLPNLLADPTLVNILLLWQIGNTSNQLTLLQPKLMTLDVFGNSARSVSVGPPTRLDIISLVTWTRLTLITIVPVSELPQPINLPVPF
jgi:hypothetical protein